MLLYTLSYAKLLTNYMNTMSFKKKIKIVNSKVPMNGAYNCQMTNIDTKYIGLLIDKTIQLLADIIPQTPQGKVAFFIY